MENDGQKKEASVNQRIQKLRGEKKIGRRPVGKSQRSIWFPRLFAGKERKNKGVQQIDPNAYGLKREQRGDQSLPAKYPGKIDIKGTDYAPYPGRIEQRELGFGDVREDDPSHLMGKHETPGTQERYQRPGVDDRGFFHAWVR